MAGYPSIFVTVDIVVLTIRGERLHVLSIRRGEPPYVRRLALPGGFVDQDEDLDTAARRELNEETGLDIGDVWLEQLRTYGAPRRDPRARTVSVAYLAVLADQPEPEAGTDAAAARWWPVDELSPKRLAFDHATILADAVERARGRLEYAPLAAAFCADEFTIAELRRVYEIVWGRSLEPANFHRKVTRARDFVVSTGRREQRGSGRPARLYRRGGATQLHPPILRDTSLSS